MVNFTRALGEKEYNQSLSTSEARLTDVELATIHGGWHGGCHGGGFGGGFGCGGPVYGGPVYGGPVYGGPVYGGPIYGGALCGGLSLCGGGCPPQPQVIVIQQPVVSTAPASVPSATVSVPSQITAHS